DQVFRGSDQADAVAGGVDDAVLDQRVLPVPAGDAVVAGEDLAAGDGDVAAGVVLPPAEVHAVPPAGDLHAAHVHTAGELQHDGVVGGVHDRDVADGHALRITEQDGVRAAQ